MNVAVVGTRTFAEYGKLCDVLQHEITREDVLITGDADGADFLARSYAMAHKIPLVVHRARWHEFGIRAGPMRNQQIVDEADKLIAFWDGKSKGTYDTIQRANKKGILVKIVS